MLQGEGEEGNNMEKKPSNRPSVPPKGCGAESKRTGKIDPRASSSQICKIYSLTDHGRPSIDNKVDHDIPIDSLSLADWVYFIFIYIP